MTAAALSAEELKSRLADRAPEVARWLLPHGLREGHEWRVGSLRGEPGGSLRVCIAGPKTGVWREFAGDAGGSNLLELVAQVRGVGFPEACRLAAEFLGLHVVEPARPPAAGPAAAPTVPESLRRAGARRPSPEEVERVASVRRLSPAAVDLARSRGLLLVGDVCGHPSWILTDEKRRVAEGRRMDGEPYPAVGSLGERKAHTLAGSKKSWPVGLAPAAGLDGFRALMLCEGGPDLLAALHFCEERWAEAADVWPVAMLGAGAGTIDADALAVLRGRRVRVYPHADEAGEKAAGRWIEQLQAAGCDCDAFDFSGLRRRDGRPVSDLNDAALADPADADELADLLP